MRIGGETPGGGPILSVGIDCQVRIRLPATSDRQFGNRAENPARASNGAEWYTRSVSPFWTLDVGTCLPGCVRLQDARRPCAALVEIANPQPGEDRKSVRVGKEGG